MEDDTAPTPDESPLTPGALDLIRKDNDRWVATGDGLTTTPSHTLTVAYDRRDLLRHIDWLTRRLDEADAAARETAAARAAEQAEQAATLAEITKPWEALRDSTQAAIAQHQTNPPRGDTGYGMALGAYNHTVKLARLLQDALTEAMRLGGDQAVRLSKAIERGDTLAANMAAAEFRRATMDTPDPDRLRVITDSIRAYGLSQFVTNRPTEAPADPPREPLPQWHEVEGYSPERARDEHFLVGVYVAAPLGEGLLPVSGQALCSCGQTITAHPRLAYKETPEQRAEAIVHQGRALHEQHAEVMLRYRAVEAEAAEDGNFDRLVKAQQAESQRAAEAAAAETDRPEQPLVPPGWEDTRFGWWREVGGHLDDADEHYLVGVMVEKASPSPRHLWPVRVVALCSCGATVPEMLPVDAQRGNTLADSADACERKAIRAHAAHRDVIQWSARKRTQVTFGMLAASLRAADREAREHLEARARTRSGDEASDAAAAATPSDDTTESVEDGQADQPGSLVIQTPVCNDQCGEPVYGLAIGGADQPLIGHCNAHVNRRGKHRGPHRIEARP